MQLLKPFETLADMLDKGPVYPEIRLQSRDVVSADTSAEVFIITQNIFNLLRGFVVVC